MARLPLLALMALGLSLVFGVMRVVNVAHGEFFMLGAVLAWWVAHLLGAVHPAVGFVAALVVAPDVPRMAIVLIDDGSGPLGPSGLEAFPFPVSFAISPNHPDPAAAAKALAGALRA